MDSIEGEGLSQIGGSEGDVDHAVDDQVHDDAARRPPRWWPLGAASVTLLVVIWLMLFTWSCIRGSHPAYLVTLTLVGVVSIAVAAWASRSTPSERSATRNWVSRAALVVGTILVIVPIVYLRPLPAEQVAIDALTDDEHVDVSISATQIRMDPVDDLRSVGLAFYPGAKVDPRAYARILRPIAEAGYTVVIFKLPYNIAFFATDAADAIVSEEDGIDSWVVGGHSLGGTVAARFARRADPEEVAGLLLWASYPATSLANSNGLDVLSVSGANDGLATPTDIEESRHDLPGDAEFVVVDGATHAFFGDYGSQDGDGKPTTTRQIAQAEIVDATLTQLRRVESG